MLEPQRIDALWKKAIRTIGVSVRAEHGFRGCGDDATLPMKSTAGTARLSERSSLRSQSSSEIIRKCVSLKSSAVNDVNYGIPEISQDLGNNASVAIGVLRLTGSP